MDHAAQTANASTELVAGDIQTATRVNQVYREYLTILFRQKYYNELYGRTVWWSKILDYLISVGSAASGGTGLGILATPAFAWACGPLTTISFFLGIAKANWGWADKSKFALDRVAFYDKLSGGYQSLVDDIDAARAWTEDFSNTRNALRQNATPSQPDPYRELRDKVKAKVQDSVQHQVQYKQWWEWKGEETNGSTPKTNTTAQTRR
jgi:hypothetical protein